MSIYLYSDTRPISPAASCLVSFSLLYTPSYIQRIFILYGTIEARLVYEYSRVLHLTTTHLPDCTTMPKGLIPLMLSPSLTESFGSGPSRTTVIHPAGQYINPSAATISPASPAHKRNASDVTPMIKLSRPPVRTTKRHSQQVPASLPVLPFTSAEWKRAITEIKKCYVTRRYRACSARCNEILTNTKDLVSCTFLYAATYHRGSFTNIARSQWCSRLI